MKQQPHYFLLFYSFGSSQCQSAFGFQSNQDQTKFFMLNGSMFICHNIKTKCKKYNKYYLYKKIDFDNFISPSI